MNKIMKTVFGSRLYGLSTPNSDTDYKGIYLPTLNELLLGTYKPYINLDTNKKGKNDSADVDEEYIALPTFIQLACKGETIAMDMLHSNVAEYDCLQDGSLGHIWVDLQNNRHRFYTKGLKSYMGYLRGHIAKNGMKGKKLKQLKNLVKMLENWDPTKRLSEVWWVLPTGQHIYKGETDGVKYWEVFGSKYQENITVKYCIEQLCKKENQYGHRVQTVEQKGVDFKASSHALRVGYQLLDLYETGFFSYPLAQTKFLLEVKKGLHDYNTVIDPELVRILQELDMLVDNSNYPDKVDKEFWDDWLLGVYNNEFTLGELW